MVYLGNKYISLNSSDKPVVLPVLKAQFTPLAFKYSNRFLSETDTVHTEKTLEFFIGEFTIMRFEKMKKK